MAYYTLHNFLHAKRIRYSTPDEPQEQSKYNKGQVEQSLGGFQKSFMKNFPNNIEKGRCINGLL